MVAVTLIPTLWSAYPLLVLPLLLTGPLAIHRLTLRPAIFAAALAGLISGTIAAESLALAWALLGDWWWMMTSAAGAPPMPPLPRIIVLPTTLMTWAHQDILFFQPLLAVVLGLVAWSAGPLGRKLGTARTTLDEELALYLQGASHADPAAWAARGEKIDRFYQALSSPAQRPGLSARPEDVVNVLSGYRSALDGAVAAHRAYRDASAEADQDGTLLVEAISALGGLQRVVEADLAGTLAESDLTHHQRLVVVMALVGGIAGLGVWTGGRALQAIGEPLAVLGAHLGRVARGDFSRLVGRVLHNLIGNAFKHGGTGARVMVVAEPADTGVRFAVDDDGPGIPEGERERVFRRRSRPADEELSRPGERLVRSTALSSAT